MLKIKSAPEKSFYSVPSKGVVICVTKPTKVKFDLSYAKSGAYATTTVVIVMPSFKGVAACNTDAGDKFDEVEGKRIAASRAFLKYTRYLEKRVMELSIDSDGNTEELVMNAMRLGTIRECEEKKKYNKDFKYTDKNAGVRKLFDTAFLTYYTYEDKPSNKEK